MKKKRKKKKKKKRRRRRNDYFNQRITNPTKTRSRTSVLVTSC